MQTQIKCISQNVAFVLWFAKFGVNTDVLPAGLFVRPQGRHISNTRSLFVVIVFGSSFICFLSALKYKYAVDT